MPTPPFSSLTCSPRLTILISTVSQLLPLPCLPLAGPPSAPSSPLTPFAQQLPPSPPGASTLQLPWLRPHAPLRPLPPPWPRPVVLWSTRLLPLQLRPATSQQPRTRLLLPCTLRLAWRWPSL